MIVHTYAAFRAQFALPGATTANDGLPAWPVAKLRAGGFTGLVTPIIAGFPLIVTCNAGVVDGGIAFDWYLSQRTDITANQYFTVTQLTATKSGSIRISVNELNVLKLLPTATEFTVNNSHPELLTPLLKNVHLYVQRRSDNAIQWIKLYV